MSSPKKVTACQKLCAVATDAEPTPRRGGDPEVAARLRAAFAYARLSKKARAAALGVGERHVHRIESAEVELDPRRLPGVIEATGVPAWFFETGFSTPPETEEPSVAEKVEALEEQMRTVLRRIGGDERRQPPGDLGRAAQGSPPSSPHPPQTGSGRAEDALRDSGEA